MVAAKSDKQPGLSNTPALRTQQELTNPAQLRILLDWVGFTFKPSTTRVSTVLNWFARHLDIPHDVWKQGRKNYEGYAHSLVYENINIYYQGQENQGIHVDITGQGCRFLDMHFRKLRVQDGYLIFWYDFLKMIHEDNRFDFTRVDIACDDFHGFLSVETIFKKCLNGELTMKFRTWSPDGNFNSNGETAGLSMYFGSDDSRLQAVFYEKNKQLQLDYHWTRVELRFKRQRANEIVTHLLNSDYDIGLVFGGILKNYLTFRVKNENDSNKRRWNVATFWANFLEGVPKLKLAAALPDRSIVRSRNWMDTQVARSLARCAVAYKDIDNDWLNKIISEGLLKLDDEDFSMIKEFRDLHNYKKNYFLEQDFPFVNQNKKSPNQED